MARLQDVEQALIRADAAGDAEAAKILAAEVRKLRSGSAFTESAIAARKDKQSAEANQPPDPYKEAAKEGSAVGNFVAGVGGALKAPYVGVKQMVGQTTPEEIRDYKRGVSGLNSTTSGFAGNVVGNLAATAPLVVAPTANTIGGGMLYGGLQGALQPVGEGESRLDNAMVGSVAGGVVPTAIRAGRVVKAAAIDPFTDAGRDRIAGGVLNRAASNPQSAFSRLLNAQGNTPGFTPSVAQAADDAGLAALERTVRAINPQGFDALDRSQRAALADALRGIAQDDIARQSAVTARDQAVNQLYSQARAANVTLDPQINAILNRPAVRQALAEAQTNAANRGRPIGTPATQPTPTGVLDANGNPIMNPGNPGSLTGNTLHEVKMALDSARDFNPMGGANRAQSNAVGEAARDFNNWLETNIPAYGQARQTYAQMSVPINQMDIGQEFVNRAIPAIYRDMPAPQQLNASAFARALVDQGDDIARRASGMDAATLRGTMSPQQMDTLNGVASDMQRMRVAENAGRGVGSDTVQKTAMTHLAAEAGIPTWLSSVARVPGGYLKRATDLLYGNSDRAVNQRLGELLADPQQAAQVMRSAGALPASRMAEFLRAMAQATPMALPQVLANPAE